MGLRPWCGMFHQRLVREGVTAHIAGRIGHQLSPEEALSRIIRTRAALETAQGSDPLTLLRSCWEALLVAPRKELGPQKGRDLSLLIVAEQHGSLALSAVGLDALWQITDEGAVQIADRNTPETTHPGLPERTPKVLELSDSGQRFVGSCLGDGRVLPEDTSLFHSPEAGP